MPVALLSLLLAAFPSPKQNIAITKDGHPVCGAVMLSENIVLTAAHCVDGEEYAEVRCGSNDMPARVVKASMDEDLAVLRFILPCDASRGFGSAAHTVLAFSDPPIGSQVHAIGYPGGNARLSRGIVSGYEVSELQMEQLIFGKHPVIISDTKIYYGNSGGGLFNPNNELVGIASQLDGAGYGYWIPVSSIHAFLDGI